MRIIQKGFEFLLRVLVYSYALAVVAILTIVLSPIAVAAAFIELSRKSPPRVIPWGD